MTAPVTLDGHSLSIADVVAVARHAAPVAIAPQALVSVAASRRAVESAVARGDTIYGVNTGFGKLAHVRIKPDQARELQLNLIRSHASGVGEPLSVDAVRAMMLLRANVLLRGTSGVRAILPELIVGMLNAQVHPRVPSQGSVGASGDLAPLAHLALAMIGEGEGEGGSALRARQLAPITLEAKVALASVRWLCRAGGGRTGPRTVRAPRGPTRTCKGWVQEAALRMLMNNLDPEVAERPQDLVVYGGTGKAARDWPAFDA